MYELDAFQCKITIYCEHKSVLSIAKLFRLQNGSNGRDLKTLCSVRNRKLFATFALDNALQFEDIKSVSKRIPCDTIGLNGLYAYLYYFK